jgi:lactoylglutathione lyase
MTLDYLVFYVESIPSLLTFYQEAFGFETKLLHESGDYAELTAGGGLTLGFCTHGLVKTLFEGTYQPLSPDQPSPGLQISILVEDVASAYHHAIACGAEGLSPPKVMPWQFEVAFLKDPQGLIIEVCKRL